MGLHPDFPLSPYEELAPDVRRFPAAKELRTTAYRKLLPVPFAKANKVEAARRQLPLNALLTEMWQLYGENKRAG
jgi:type III restriction enzyme